MAFQFNISRDDLLKAISTQQNITSKKGTLAILSNVLLEVGHDNITFTGTDLEKKKAGVCCAGPRLVQAGPGNPTGRIA